MVADAVDAAGTPEPAPAVAAEIFPVCSPCNFTGNRCLHEDSKKFVNPIAASSSAVSLSEEILATYYRDGKENDVPGGPVALHHGGSVLKVKAISKPVATEPVFGSNGSVPQPVLEPTRPVRRSGRGGNFRFFNKLNATVPNITGLHSIPRITFVLISTLQELADRNLTPPDPSQ